MSISFLVAKRPYSLSRPRWISSSRYCDTSLFICNLDQITVRGISWRALVLLSVHAQVLCHACHWTSPLVERTSWWDCKYTERGKAEVQVDGDRIEEDQRGHWWFDERYSGTCAWKAWNGVNSKLIFGNILILLQMHMHVCIYVCMFVWEHVLPL